VQEVYDQREEVSAATSLGQRLFVTGEKVRARTTLQAGGTKPQGAGGRRRGHNTAGGTHQQHSTAKGKGALGLSHPPTRFEATVQGNLEHLVDLSRLL